MKGVKQNRCSFSKQKKEPKYTIIKERSMFFKIDTSPKKAMKYLLIVFLFSNYINVGCMFSEEYQKDEKLYYELKRERNDLQEKIAKIKKEREQGIKKRKKILEELSKELEKYKNSETEKYKFEIIKESTKGEERLAELSEELETYKREQQSQFESKLENLKAEIYKIKKELKMLRMLGVLTDKRIMVEKNEVDFPTCLRIIQNNSAEDVSNRGRFVKAELKLVYKPMRIRERSGGFYHISPAPSKENNTEVFVAIDKPKYFVQVKKNNVSELQYEVTEEAKKKKNFKFFPIDEPLDNKKITDIETFFVLPENPRERETLRINPKIIPEKIYILTKIYGKIVNLESFEVLKKQKTEIKSYSSEKIIYCQDRIYQLEE